MMRATKLFHLSISYSKINIFLLIMVAMIFEWSNCDEQFKNCSRAYSCGSIHGIGYPFWGDDRPSFCGLAEFQIYCVEGEYPSMSSFDTSSNGSTYQTFRVLRIDQSAATMTIVISTFWDDVCPTSNTVISSLRQLVPAPNGFAYASTNKILNIFYGCNPEVIAKVQIKTNVTCPTSVNDTDDGVFFADSFITDVNGCKDRLKVRIRSTAYDQLWDGKLTLHQALKQGFDVEYSASLLACSTCETSGGICGSDSNFDHFLCLCPDKPYPAVCPMAQNGTNKLLKAIIGASTGGMVILAACIILCFYRYKFPSNKIISFPWKQSKDDKNLEGIIRKYRALAINRYRYSDVRKMTNFFKDKLGEGGFGSVYKGNLCDGRLVAVKILNESRSDGEEFINEVASISRTSHVNIVSLLGFCVEGQKRALIYQFMPNGSLEKFIYDESASENSGRLGWEKLYQIAIGIAQGLEYLHRGCNTRILHLDIKPHNILLDEDFCPKISDFGLSKLCLQKESIVSMLGARGTIGYIAPEVVSRCFGRVSHKSDVFSYGMMVLEMVAGRKNVNNIASHTSKIYFPHWVYKHLLMDEDIGLQGITIEEESKIAKNMAIVGLWCIQADPSQRPCMGEVIDMLEGNVDALEMPPKPYLCSPPISNANSFVTFSSSDLNDVNEVEIATK